MAFVSSSRILAIVLGVAALLAALPQGSQAPWSGGLASLCARTCEHTQSHTLSCLGPA